MINQWSVRFRFGLHLLPFRVGLESSAIFLRLLPAGMLQNVDEQVLRIRRILGRPVTNAFHVVSLEDRISVTTKARFQSIHFSLLGVIQAQFINVRRQLCVGRTEFAEGEHQCDPKKKDKTYDGFSAFSRCSTLVCGVTIYPRPQRSLRAAPPL